MLLSLECVDQCNQTLVKAFFFWGFDLGSCAAEGWEEEMYLEAKSRSQAYLPLILKLRTALCSVGHISLWIATRLIELSLSWCRPAPFIIPALLTRRIFSKPSPSTKVSTSSQLCTSSWHAAAALCWEDFLLPRYREMQRNKAQSVQADSDLVAAFPFTASAACQVRMCPYSFITAQVFIFCMCHLLYESGLTSVEPLKMQNWLLSVTAFKYVDETHMLWVTSL